MQVLFDRVQTKEKVPNTEFAQTQFNLQRRVDTLRQIFWREE